MTFEQFNDKIEENKNFSNFLVESQFDDLFERDPYLNHLRNVQEDMFLQMYNMTPNDNFVIPEPQIVEEKIEIVESPPPRPPSIDEWQTVVARRRKSSCNTEVFLIFSEEIFIFYFKYLSHRPSPCTDDGYMVSC